MHTSRLGCYWKKNKNSMQAAISYKIVYTVRFLWTALVGNNWRERCCHSVLFRVPNIIYSLFGIGTSASRDNHCPIIPFLFLCAAVSLSLFPIKKGKEKHTYKKKKKRKKMIATILEPRNQVIDWSSRKLDLYSRQGFSFSPV